MGRAFRVVTGLLLLSVVGILYLFRNQAVDPTMTAKIAPFFVVPGVLLVVSGLFRFPSRGSVGGSLWQEAPSARVWGTGVGLLDYRPVGPGLFEATRWFTLLYVPLIPGPTWVIRPRGGGSSVVGPAVLTSYSFDRVAEKKTPPSRIARTYAVGFMAACAAFGPAALAIWTYNRLSLNSALLVTLATLIPPIAIFWFFSKREASVFQTGESSEARGRPTRR